MSILLHQLLHGYRRGHQLLAASIQLSPRDADLVERLSDLSGSLADNSEFKPYITAYPLLDSKYYALAKTWLDTNAQRSGCVITHTILIPIIEWATSPFPHAFSKLFSLPTNIDDTEKYRVPINASIGNNDGESAHISEEVMFTFVVKYFGEGLRPLVWFDKSNREDVFWLLLTKLWPNLRKQFACCTYSLQPRALEGRPFDLMFAPSTVYSRFQKIPRENRIDEVSLTTDSKLANDISEPWYLQWARAILNSTDNAKQGSLTEELNEFGPYLGEDPTEIRKLYLINEFRNRVSESPSAAVGFMDIVESLAPLINQATDYKRNVLKQVLQVLANLTDDNSDALKYYYLVAERLTHAAFNNISSEASQKICTEVADWTYKFPNIALNVEYNYFFSKTEKMQSAFEKGIVNGLCKLADNDPAKLVMLNQYSELASSIMAWEPQIAAGYFKGIKSQNSYEKIGDDFTTWLVGLSDATLFSNLRDVLLPEIANDLDAPIAEVLLRNLPEKEISKVLNTLVKSTDSFASSIIRQLVVEQLSFRHTRQVRQWCQQSDVWSSGIAAIAAATYTSDSTGLQELLNNPVLEPLRKAQTICAFLDMLSVQKLPLWLRDYIKQNPELFVPMLSLGSSTPSEISHTIARLLKEVRDIPIARVLTLADEIDKFQLLPFGDLLTDQALRSSTQGFITGDLDWHKSERWYSTKAGHQWLNTISDRELETIITMKSTSQFDAWCRAWEWLASAPGIIYQRVPSPLPALTHHLLACYKPNWNFTITNNWAKILRRSSTEADDSTYLRLCADALGFAWDHIQYPVEKLVVESFSAVYVAVTEAITTPQETSELFNIFDWDKGKELRRKLVDSFYRSDWAPGDLALALRDEHLLKKIFKRIVRKWDGEKYIQQMLKDLAKRKDPIARRAFDNLSQLVRNPNFQEPWD